MNANFPRERRCPGWPEHWSNGGTGVTKTSEPDTTAIAASVTAFNDPQIFMRGSELHATRRPCDLSDFWAFHDAQQNSSVK